MAAGTLPRRRKRRSPSAARDTLKNVLTLTRCNCPVEVPAANVPWREFEMGPVSVVIPVYNRTAELRRAVRSVLAQTYADLELIVVDDASSEDIAGALDGIDDPRLKLIRKSVNQGAAAARNTGIQAATGRWVAFLDSDDEWLPQKLELQLRRLVDRPDDARICCSG